MPKVSQPAVGTDPLVISHPIQPEPLIPLPEISAGNALAVVINEVHRPNYIGISVITEHFLDDFERKLAENCRSKTAVPVQQVRRII